MKRGTMATSRPRSRSMGAHHPPPKNRPPPSLSVPPCSSRVPKAAASPNMVSGGCGGDAFADVAGQGPWLAGLQVDANAGQKSARGKLLGLLICHFVGKEEGFFANLLKG